MLNNTGKLSFTEVQWFVLILKTLWEMFVRASPSPYGPCGTVCYVTAVIFVDHPFRSRYYTTHSTTTSPERPRCAGLSVRVHGNAPRCSRRKDVLHGMHGAAPYTARGAVGKRPNKRPSYRSTHVVHFFV